MSVSAVAPTPFYQDPERLPIGLPPAATQGGDKAEGSAQAQDGKHLSMFGDEEPSFWDVLDVINPLQHIPVVSNIYRELTGDQIGVGARLVGGALFGGPIGLIASAVDCVVEESTGKDTGEHVLAMFRDEGQSSPEVVPATQFAQDQPTPASAATNEAAPSSPAPVAAAETAPASAPVISLPEGGGAIASRPMFFGPDGLQEIGAAPAAPATTAPVKLTTAAEAGVTVAAARPAALQTSTKGFMPVPPRAAPGDVRPAPQITVPVSSGTMRSNVPVTGRAPPSTAQTVALSQQNLANHPMMPPVDANGQTAAGPDWFTAAWSQALDKYQRANQRNDGTPASTTSTLQ